MSMKGEPGIILLKTNAEHSQISWLGALAMLCYSQDTRQHLIRLWRSKKDAVFNMDEIIYSKNAYIQTHET